MYIIQYMKCGLFCLPVQAVIDGLIKKNHLIEMLTSMGAVVQAILQEENRLYAESDPRKGGYSAGY